MPSMGLTFQLNVSHTSDAGHADHGVVYPRREEGVDGCRVDQLSVVGKDGPEKQNNKLNRRAESRALTGSQVSRGHVHFSCRVFTIPTGKPNTENRKSLHFFKGLSVCFPGWRSLTAASPKNVIWSNWNVFFKKNRTTGYFLPNKQTSKKRTVQQTSSPSSRRWDTSTALRT